MSVWVCAPSARDGGGTFPLFRKRGYKLCVWRDAGAPEIDADHVITGEWKGVYFAANRCFEWVFENDSQCDWSLFCGDDTTPDPNKGPGQIAKECSNHFSGIDGPCIDNATFGVCQPCGDDWTDSKGRVIERIAGSPFVGREFARRINQGRGVFWEEYFHMGGDEELWNVARNLGVYWERHDLCHLHQHWGRPKPGEKMVINPVIPKFLARANSPEEWRHFQKVFNERKRAGFPGSECLP